MGNLYKPTRHDQSVALGASALHTPLTQGLVGLWRMEEALWDGTAGEVFDSSGNGNNGVAVNGVSTIAGGKLGRGGDFTAASNHHINVVTTWADFMSITISAWIYPVSDAAISAIIGSEIVSGSATQLRMEAGSRVVTIFANSLTDTSHSSVGVSLTLNAWNHVVYVFDGASAFFVIDGVKNNIQAQGGFIRMRSTVHIGRANDADPTRDMDGRLDEIAVWDRGLNDNEADKIYNAGLALAII